MKEVRLVGPSGDPGAGRKARRHVCWTKKKPRRRARCPAPWPGPRAQCSAEEVRVGETAQPPSACHGQRKEVFDVAHAGEDLVEDVLRQSIHSSHDVHLPLTTIS